MSHLFRVSTGALLALAALTLPPVSSGGGDSFETHYSTLLVPATHVSWTELGEDAAAASEAPTRRRRLGTVEQPFAGAIELSFGAFGKTFKHDLMLMDWIHDRESYFVLHGDAGVEEKVSTDTCWCLLLGRFLLHRLRKGKERRSTGVATPVSRIPDKWKASHKPSSH